MDSIADEGQCPAWDFMDKVCDASVRGCALVMIGTEDVDQCAPQEGHHEHSGHPRASQGDGYAGGLIAP